MQKAWLGGGVRYVEGSGSVDIGGGISPPLTLNQGPPQCASSEKRARGLREFCRLRPKGTKMKPEGPTAGVGFLEVL